MATAETTALAALYETDETAWLEVMADLAAAGRCPEMDFANLSEFLTSMAKRDRREVYSRLVVLLTHLLKWDAQPDRRGVSWRVTVRTQRSKLGQLLDSRTLWNHAEAALADAYAEARERAADETELPVATFPAANPWTLADALAAPLA